MIAQQGTLEISRGRLRHNVDILRRIAGSAKLAAVVKADAYGHGQSLIMPELMDAGVEWFMVYSVAEAIGCLKRLESATLAGHVRPQVLAMAPVTAVNGRILDVDEPAGSPDASMPLSWALGQGNLRLNVTSVADAVALDDYAGVHHLTGVRVHVQVDVGLTRMGVHPSDAAALLREIASLKNVRLEGIFGHLSHSEEPGHPTHDQQVRVLAEVVDVGREMVGDLLVHLQNSGGVRNLSGRGLDLARVGIALYGLQPSIRHPIAGLLPIARVVAPVLAVHERGAGTGVGYGHMFVTTRASRLAVVPVGYADGYPRGLLNRGVAQVRDMDVPVVGRVSMDQIILDVTDVAGAAVLPGELVTVVAWDSEKGNCLDKMADAVGTIGYELATHIGAGGGRVRRVVVE